MTLCQRDSRNRLTNACCKIYPQTSVLTCCLSYGWRYNLLPERVLLWFYGVKRKEILRFYNLPSIFAAILQIRKSILNTQDDDFNVILRSETTKNLEPCFTGGNV